MTANARLEDAQACRDAGMNDFVTKPVVPGQFYATVVKWVVPPVPGAEQVPAALDAPTQPGALTEAMSGEGTRPMLQPAELRVPVDAANAGLATPPEPGPASGAVPASENPELLDLSVLTQLTRRNPKMMREIATVFLAFMERTMGELDAALLAGDRAKLSALGHKAKSSAAAVGAMGLSALCHRLESSMKDAAVGLDEAHRLVTAIRSQMGPIADKFATVLS